MNNKSVVIVGGFANSGKGALVYCLSEIETASYIDNEPRFITDPDGLMSLESALIDNWNIFQADIAIKRFKKITTLLSNKYKYPYFWKSLHQFASGNFRRLAKEYIDDLIDYEYKGFWTGINNPLYKLVYKVNRTFNIRILRYSKKMYGSMTSDSFFSKTREFTEKFVNESLEVSQNTLVINEPFASINPIKIMNYFNNARVIIVQRDPRDSYVNLMEEQSDFMPKNVDEYIKYFKFSMTQSMKNGEDSRVLRIKFEDLIFSYDTTIDKVFQFTGLKKKNHINQFKNFDPKISVKNVGIWKNYKDQVAITKIQKNLRDYCY